MKARRFIAVAFLVVLGLFGIEARGRFSADLKTAIHAADSARVVAGAAVARAQAAEAFAVANQVLVAQAESERRLALAGEAQWKARFRSASVVAPDSCKPVIIAADSAIAAADSAAAASERKASLLQSSLDSVSRSTAVLIPAAIDLSHATARLETAARPSLFSRLLPRVGFGLAAGVEIPTGEPRALIGFTLSWTK